MSFSFIWQVFIEIVYIIYPKAPFILLKRPPPDLGFLVVVVVTLGLAAGLAVTAATTPLPPIGAGSDSGLPPRKGVNPWVLCRLRLPFPFSAQIVDLRVTYTTHHSLCTTHHTPHTSTCIIVSCRTLSSCPAATSLFSGLGANNRIGLAISCNGCHSIRFRGCFA